METIQFNTIIDADRKKVWDTMLGDKTYRQWTMPFHPGSFFEGNWEKGSDMKFMAPGENGTNGGMFSRIKENIPQEFVSIEHLGMINDGVVDTTSDKVNEWAPSFENYTFKEKDGKTEVIVEMQTPTEYKSMFNEMWPRALSVLKELSEK